MKFHFILVAVCLSGCSERDEILVNSTVSLEGKPLVITPRGSIAAPGYFSLLCVKVAAPFQIDGLVLRNPGGGEIRLQATLTTVGGQQHRFKQSGVMQGGYILLVSDPPQSPGVRYRSISISSTEPFETSQIRWISSDKM